MKVRVFQIFYKNEDGNMVPVDQQLVDLAQDFVSRELSYKATFLDYRNLWAACEVDEADKPTRCLGLLGLVNTIACPLFRFTDNVACKKLVDRVNGFLHDQGYRGQRILVHVDPDEPEEAKCPDQAKWMEAFQMKAAKCWTFLIR